VLLETCIASGKTLNVPLHLTSGTRVYVRPVPDEAHLQALAPFPSDSDAALGDLSGVVDEDDSRGEAPRRALVCLQRKCTHIEHPTWGAVPDISILILPKYTLENRLPIGLQFTLSAPHALAPAGPAALAEAHSRTHSRAPSTSAPVSRALAPRRPPSPTASAGAAAPLPLSPPALPLSPAVTSPPQGALARAAAAARRFLPDRGFRGSSADAEDRAGSAGSREGASAGEGGSAGDDWADGGDGGVGGAGAGGAEEEGVALRIRDALPIGDHCELMAPFLLEEDKPLSLELRYVEDGIESASEYAAGEGGGRESGRGAQAGEEERAGYMPRSEVRLKAREAMDRSQVAWALMERRLDLSTFERKQEYKRSRGRLPREQSQPKRSRTLARVRLNEQMEVWVQLTEGGANQPLRIVVWADIAVINQTTVSLEYVAATTSAAPLLPSPERAIAERGCRLRAEALSLLCLREAETRATARIAVKLLGTNRAITRNQQVEVPAGAGGEPLQICEPHEAQLCRALRGAVSTPISTHAATHSGEAWLGGGAGVLGVSTQLQAQEAVPHTAIVSIKPRVMLVNKLGVPLQYLASHAAADDAKPHARKLSDIVRQPHATFASANSTALARTEGSSGSLSSLLALAERGSRARGRSPAPEPARGGAGSLPSLPPSACCPIYHFELDSDGAGDDGARRKLLSRLRLRVRLATEGSVWSPSLSLSEMSDMHFFARAQGGGAGGGTNTVVRLALREAAPTIFVVVEDASASPPCCIRNELDSDLWFAVRLPASGRGAERDLVWDVLPAGSGDVPLLWDENRLVRQGSAAAGEKAASSLSVLLSSCEPEAAGGMSHYVQFGFGELYAVRPLRDAEHGRVAFGRVIMHESGVDTRVLRVTKQIDASEQMDASGPRAGPQSRPYPAGSGRLLLPSDMLLPPVGASPALRRLALAPGAAVPAEDAQSPLSYSVELELHGLSIAIIDAAPKELLQLNLRHINIGFVSDGAASRITCGVGSLSVDNLLNESFNPLVLWSDEPDSSGAVKPFLKLDADRRLNHAHASFKKVEAKVAPLNLVLDLALLKALSQTQWSQDGPAAGRQVVPIGSSRRLVSTFRALRHGGIAVPVEATQRGAVTGAGGELYLQHVSLSPLKLRATVAMGATFVADPKRELLEVIERLLPRVPDGLEILLPMLSNLASVTDASFSVSAFEVHDVFSSLGALAAVAATQWSSEMMRDLMVAMGSIDMCEPLPARCFSAHPKPRTRLLARAPHAQVWQPCRAGPPVARRRRRGHRARPGGGQDEGRGGVWTVGGPRAAPRRHWLLRRLHLQAAPLRARLLVDAAAHHCGEPPPDRARAAARHPAGLRGGLARAQAHLSRRAWRRGAQAACKRRAAVR